MLLAVIHTVWHISGRIQAMIRRPRRHRVMKSCPTSLLIEVLLYGGAPNPLIELNANDSALFCAGAVATFPTCNHTRVLGFNGWRAVQLEQDVVGSAAIDHLMLGQPGFAALGAEVRAHVTAEASRLASACPAGANMVASPDAAQDKVTPSQQQQGCGSVVVGPDSPEAVKFAPASDDDGCFVKRQYDNNCCAPTLTPCTAVANPCHMPCDMPDTLTFQ